MNDLTIRKDAVPIGDGWDDAAAEASQRVLRGTILRFADWKWTAGKEATPIAEGTELVALSTAAAWVKWKGGKPVEYRMKEPSKPLPEREELGDEKGGDWELGPDGQPRDPWQNTRFVYLLNQQTAAAFTFSTSSYGGRRAVVDLADQIQRMRAAHPDALPIVALASEPMQTKFGRKSKPVFRVTGWIAGGDEPRQSTRLAPPTMRDDLNDEIPL